MPITRRRLLDLAAMAGLASAGASTMAGAQATQGAPVRTGADLLARDGFAPLRNLRVGLITNQTGRIGDQHLADALAAAPGVTLAAILAPEHGFRGTVEAGALVANDRDARTGVPVLSLYGASRKPTAAMLQGLDALVFDIQDIGVRFYTYISTMGLAMQAAAAARKAFVVLDRPNPLGGSYVAGFTLRPELRSFVGQYTIPIVHGMTVAELAWMIKGEKLLPGLEDLDLRVMKLEGWRRGMRWSETGLAWVATSPNIPSFHSALVYPGIGFVGEMLVNEGRGTPIPFQQFGAPWVDQLRLREALVAAKLPGLAVEAVSYVPKAIAQVAATPRFRDETVKGVRLQVTDASRVAPLETGMHVVAALYRQAEARRRPLLPPSPRMLHQIAGTPRFLALLKAGAGGPEIAAAWRDDVTAFEQRRQAYLLYPG